MTALLTPTTPDRRPAPAEPPLRRNDAAYAEMLRLLGRLRGRNPDAALALGERVAEFAESCHTGRFADGALENLGLEAGARLGGCARCGSAADRRRVLHLATAVLGVGGHTRTIHNWVRSDPSSRHSVLVTAQ